MFAFPSFVSTLSLCSSRQSPSGAVTLAPPAVCITADDPVLSGERRTDARLLSSEDAVSGCISVWLSPRAQLGWPTDRVERELGSGAIDCSLLPSGSVAGCEQSLGLTRPSPPSVYGVGSDPGATRLCPGSARRSQRQLQGWRRAARSCAEWGWPHRLLSGSAPLPEPHFRHA